MANKIKIAAIFAHPDDLTLSAAGTIARWAEEGREIFTLCCTNGEVGTLRRDLTKEDVARKREEELKAANTILGVKDSYMLGYPDAGFINGYELRKELIYYVRKLKIDRIVTFDPWVKYEIHPDHVIVGRMAAEAGAFAAFPLLHEDQLIDNIEPYSCSEVWFMGLLGHNPNYIVDISHVFEKKINAALKFDSTVELLSELFGIKLSSGKVSKDQLNKLFKSAKRLLQSVASAIGKKYNLDAAEAFYVQRTLPGHFDNFQEILSENLGNPTSPPKIY
jgi:LmbE family N-acetylglucosaminyl deacetylase